MFPQGARLVTATSTNTEKWGGCGLQPPSLLTGLYPGAGGRVVGTEKCLRREGCQQPSGAQKETSVPSLWVDASCSSTEGGTAGAGVKAGQGEHRWVLGEEEIQAQGPWREQTVCIPGPGWRDRCCQPEPMLATVSSWMWCGRLGRWQVLVMSPDTVLPPPHSQRNSECACVSGWVCLRVHKSGYKCVYL